MNNDKILVEFILNDCSTYIVQRKYMKNYSLKTEYVFFYGNTRYDKDVRRTTNSTHKTIGSAMKKFNKAVAAIKNGTKIK